MLPTAERINLQHLTFQMWELHSQATWAVSMDGCVPPQFPLSGRTNLDAHTIKVSTVKTQKLNYFIEPNYSNSTNVLSTHPIKQTVGKGIRNGPHVSCQMPFLMLKACGWVGETLSFFLFFSPWLMPGVMMSQFLFFSRQQMGIQSSILHSQLFATGLGLQNP